MVLLRRCAAAPQSSRRLTPQLAPITKRHLPLQAPAVADGRQGFNLAQLEIKPNQPVASPDGGVFSWVDRSAPSDQSRPHDLLSSWASFIQELQASNKRDLLWPGVSADDVNSLSTTAALLVRPDFVEWFPDCGCALLAISTLPASDDGGDTRPLPRHARLLLVGLDSWNFHLHSTSVGPSLQHTAICNDHAVQWCGMVPATGFRGLVANVHNEVQRRVEQRAKDNMKGVHKTPAFIQAIVRDVLAGSMSGSLPQGGFTDVGMHTGTQPRNTTWPMLREAIKAVLLYCGVSDLEACSPPAVLSEQAFTYYELWQLLKFVGSLNMQASTPAAVNMGMRMLESVALRAAEVSAAGQDVGHIEASCDEAKRRLQELVSQRALEAAEQTVLGNVAAHGAGSLTSTTQQQPHGLIPALPPVQLLAMDVAAILARANQNLGSLPLLPSTSTPSQLQQLLRIPVWSAAGDADISDQLQLRNTEQALFTKVLAVPLGQMPVMSEYEVQVVADLIDEYRVTMQRFLHSRSRAECMHAEQHSRELLVVWVGYCLIHATACQVHPVLGGFGVSLRWEDLRHLVLPDHQAVSVALRVAAYLQANTMPGREAFSLRDGGQATFAMALEFGLQDAKLLQLWQQEETDAAARTKGHWDEVQRKQRLAASIRQELSTLRSRLAAEEKELARATQACIDEDARVRLFLQELRWPYVQHAASSKKGKTRSPRPGGIGWLEWAGGSADLRSPQHPSSKCDELQAEKARIQAQCDSIQRQINSKESELKEAEKAPTSVLQPLPRQRQRGLQWLFFLHMPRLLRCMSRASFLAQQMLLPPLSQLRDVQSAIKWPVSGHLKTSMVSHYNGHQRSYYYSPKETRRGADGRVQLRSPDGVPNDVGPTHVDHCRSPDDGVWYPDSLDLQMAWIGSGCSVEGAQGFPSVFNPFGTFPECHIALWLTEKLSTPDSALDWALPIPGEMLAISADRGNMPIAQQDQRPGWLSKPGFLDFGRLRSYPLGQMRRLCAALHDRTLHLSHAAVSTLIKQAVFHLGTLAPTQPPSLSWRADWDSGVLAALYDEVSRLAEELQDAPREHSAVPLLGELSACLSGWHAPFADTARRFADMTSRVADQMDMQIEDAAESSEVAAQQLQAAQCRARMWSLLCYAGRLALRDDDAHKILRLTVLINHGDVFLQNASLRRELRSMRVRCFNLVAARAEDLVNAAKLDGSALTAAVATVLQRTPANLKWSQASASGTRDCSFHAKGSDGHLYSINILDGTVLLDGSPPSRLPKDITSHRLYQRTFGTVNFKVASTADGDLQTIKPVEGCFYDFRLGSDGQLLIREVDPQHKVTLQLLDVGQDGGCGTWGDQLPVRLRQLHSHWMNREQGVILLRPPTFLKRSIAFLIQVQPALRDEPRQRYHCWRIPTHLRSLHWTEIISSRATEVTDLMVLDRSHIMQRVLAKFEDPAFIHTFVRGPSLAAVRLTGFQAASKGHNQTLVFELARFQLEFLLEGNNIVSADYSGYRLADTQQLVEPSERDPGFGPCTLYTLPELRQYLVLRQIEGRRLDVGLQKSEVLVLVPVGEVQVAREGAGSRGDAVCIDVPHGCGATIKAHCYSVHRRFGYLEASTVLARLQLAALYAATSTLLPEPRNHLTGAQMALQLMRQSWVHRPLKKAEEAQLQSVVRLGGHLLPALHVVAAEQQLSSNEVHYLHNPDAPGTQGGDASLLLNPDTCSAYYQQQRQAALLHEMSGSAHPHTHLSPLEERRVMGSMPWSLADPVWMQRSQHLQVHIPSCPVDPGLVASTEASLMDLVVWSKAKGHSQRAVHSYPLSACNAQSTPLEAAMHEELRESWDTHNATAVPQGVKPQAPATIANALAHITSSRQHVEQHLLQHVWAVPKTEFCPHQSSFRLLRTACLAPTAGLVDLMRLALEPQLLRHLNPFLTHGARSSLISSVLLWLQLCVLEDRLERMNLLAQGGPDWQPLLMQELLTHRTWDVERHPNWLVFEVEGQLQIRPVQHTVAQHLMDSMGSPNTPGPIVQLNMGEGKTRVILPMLALHWADGDKLVRLNFLSQLLDEAHDHLHRHLCASVLGRKLFRLPFHRDVAITQQGAKAMVNFLNYCAKAGGLLLTAPEHRLSLQLKWHELRGRGSEEALSTCQALDKVFNLPYVDILDESDELLHHRYQLVYACGNSMALPALQERVDAARALLHVVSHHAHSGNKSLRKSGVADWAPMNKPGAFCGLRLLGGSGSTLQQQVPALHRQWAELLVQSPPYSLRWLGTPSMQDRQIQDRIIRYITDSSVDASHALGPELCSRLESFQMSHLMALRGLLACNILQHCLQKRHGVTYGVSRLPSARKRLAVPFRAVETPSERSEYAQPDVAIVLTLLSYAYDGLSKAELQAAVQALLRLGRSSQHHHYNEWLQQAQLASRTDIDAATISALDDVCKLDPSNLPQLDLLHRVFSHNTCVVGFWLETCVLPVDTKQYPQRLACSAWHLADNKRGDVHYVAGFSGTNDNHRLLPLQVQQHLAVDPLLQGTNGKMLGIILDNPSYATLAAAKNVPQWRQLLDHVLRSGKEGRQVHALIDCGALLEGTTNKEAAEFLLPLLDQALFQGVCYFDVARKQWMMRERNGRVLPRQASPVAERQAFVIYDEARCRGADMQLRPDAVGLLTLSQGMCKDKLMQAAGRLRRLGRGQRLSFVGPPDVTAKIAATCGLGASSAPLLTSRHMLQWVMDNTVAATQSGLMEWARQGLHFATTKGLPDRARQDEQLELAGSYAGARQLEDVGQVVQAMVHQRVAASGSELVEEMRAVAGKISERGVLHGKGHKVETGQHSADEECERELEREEEEEEEVEKQVERVQARLEQDWDYSAALSATSAEQLRVAASALSLQDVAHLLKPSSISSIPWSSAVLCTRNFVHAIATGSTASSGSSSLSEYLRPVDAALRFLDGTMLLVSEREADALIRVARASARARTSVQAPVLVSRCYAQHAWRTGQGVTLALPLRPMTTVAALPPADAMASVQLFDGQTSYGGQAGQVFAEAKRLVRRRREDCLELVGMRGKQSMFSHSELEAATDDVQAKPLDGTAATSSHASGCCVV